MMVTKLVNQYFTITDPYIAKNMKSMKIYIQDKNNFGYKEQDDPKSGKD